jgi:hypothetical protein
MKVSQAVNYCLEYHGAHSKKKYEPSHGVRPIEVQHPVQRKGPQLVNPR